MAQQKFTLGGEVIPQPHDLGYSFETTYTEDSGRVQTGGAVVSRLFTVEAFDFRYEWISLAEAHRLQQLILKGEPVLMHYLSVYYNGWRDDYFYVGKGSNGNMCITEDGERIEDFSFRAVGVNPVD